MYEGTLNVLKKINLELEKGEKVALVGESGSGKSVTTKLIFRTKSKFARAEANPSPEVIKPKQH